MLTNKAKYGLKAMVHLAKTPPGHMAHVNDIATANQIPKRFLLDAILAELRNAGYVHSKKGLGGGYMLARPADGSELATLFAFSTDRWRPFNARARHSISDATIVWMKQNAPCASL